MKRIRARNDNFIRKIDKLFRCASAFTNNNSLSDNIDTLAMSHRHYQVISSINDYGRCTFEVLTLYVRLGSNSTACTNVNISEIFKTRHRNRVLISSRYRHFSTLLVETGEGTCFFSNTQYSNICHEKKTFRKRELRFEKSNAFLLNRLTGILQNKPKRNRFTLCR